MVARAQYVPILPGKLEAWRAFWAQWQTPEGKKIHDEARRRAGITREVISLQQTDALGNPIGDWAVVYIDMKYDRAKMKQEMYNVPSPFRDKFLAMIKEVHGLDAAPPNPFSEPIFDWSE
jgi:hypothetical protein